MENNTKKINITTTKKYYPTGWFNLPFGILSVMVSWYFNKSILWAIFHYVFSVPNLIYRLLNGSFKDGGFMEIIKFYI